MRLFRFLPVLIVIAFTACKEPVKSLPKEEVKKDSTTVTPKNKRPVSLENGKFFEKNGVRYLYGGEEENQHFDLTGYTLKDENFHYGIGREAFPALLKPQFTTITAVDTSYEDSDRFLILKGKNVIKAYSVRDLTHYEVVNDVIDGKPVMAAYCVLADLGAIYDRVLYGKEFTFALTGYTYYDDEVWNGLDGFMLWDRETESMWWPLTGKAVSGKMKGADMKLYDESTWEQTTWKKIKENYPNAQVLISGQDFERPKTWKHYDNVDLTVKYDNSVAPKWGEKNN
jgi:hypothetical protein